MPVIPEIGTSGFVYFGQIPRQLPPNSRIPILPNGIDGRTCKSGAGIIPNNYRFNNRDITRNVRFGNGIFEVNGYKDQWRFYWLFDIAGSETQAAAYTADPNAVEVMPGEMAERIVRYYNLLWQHVGKQAVQIGVNGSSTNRYSTLANVDRLRLYRSNHPSTEHGAGGKQIGIATFDIHWDNPGFVYQIGSGYSDPQATMPSGDGDNVLFTGSSQGYRIAGVAVANDATVQTGDIYLITNPGATDYDGRVQDEGTFTPPAARELPARVKFPYQAVSPLAVRTMPRLNSIDLGFAPDPPTGAVSVDNAFYLSLIHI